MLEEVLGVRILVVEDEKHLAEALAQILKENKYTVDTVFDGEAGVDYALSGVYDVIILDIMLPVKNGMEVLSEIRKNSISTPVILLTAKQDVSDRIAGLDAGADDYLAKPFNTGELLARVRALHRRSGEKFINNKEITFGDITLDTGAVKLSGPKKTVSLTKKEIDLLEYLIINKSLVVSKENIIDKLWGFDSEAEANHVEVYISFLRKKLAFVSDNVIIDTVRRIGYRIEVREREDA